MLASTHFCYTRSSTHCTSCGIVEEQDWLGLRSPCVSMSGTERELKRIAVFCGANAGGRPEYLQSAKEVGKELVKRKIGLVYGGMFCQPSYAPGFIACNVFPPCCRWKCRYDGSCCTNSEFCMFATMHALLSYPHHPNFWLTAHSVCTC